MSVDTRTPRTPSGGGAPGFDERVLTMPRVPSDPAQVIVNHASFRVQLGATSSRALGSDGIDATTKIPVVPQSAGRRRAAPVVWSGQSAPGDPLAGELLQAVRRAAPGTATQVLPRVDDTSVLPPAVPTVVGQRSAPSPTGLLPRRGGGEDEPVVGWTGGDGQDRSRYRGYEPDGYAGYDGHQGPGAAEAEQRPRNRRGEPVKHAWYPGRRMNLGIVLLPLRVFLGFVCIYAGMGKLCDPVYFDGGRRGSMVTWLTSLHPWALAEPLRDAALSHPVGAGLSIAFLQVVVGVLTVCGLWQRVAAVFGAGLSVALLVTVSWRTVPVYDAPDFIYLAAWSPLVIAGAPVYSIDGRLAGDAWRRLGPRVALWDLRRRVLRRGAVLATVIIGATLLVGSVLGTAVRATSTHEDRPGPAVVPTNNLPGSPLPEVSGGAGDGGTPSPSASARAKKKEEHEEQATQAPTTAPRTHRATGGAPVPGRSSTGGSGGTPTGSGSGSGSTGAGSQPPVTQAPTQAPPPPPPTAKPSQGAIGGLLGSHSPTGLLLGLPAAPSTPAGAA
ncbi:DoxX family protein [Streptomyces sp. V4-01]|uniref:DoxX family protein n=1 Tax=Actinacidiphila polyblastidii TaxID=3110430 RepID=A0ABU7PIY5_9ACTN|nr:DoxX family protein [Streptomyces sp. V4-01]